MRLVGVLCFLLAGVTASAGETFTNPVAKRGADPWVIAWKGSYYYCRSTGGSIRVGKTERLQDIGQTRMVEVWRPENGKPYSKELWAPELHVLNSKLYIYVAADDGNNDNHRMYVLESMGNDPQGTYVLKGKITSPDDHWAIDGTVLEHGGKLFFIWSGWEGSDNVAQHLYIAPMSNPWTVSGPRVRISSPDREWEQRGGRPWINEGPEALRRDAKVFLVYSASGSWSDFYCLGLLELIKADPLAPDAWKKHGAPVFQGTEQAISPGHCSFVKSPDGKEDWIVYHTARKKGSGWDRQVNIQKFGWTNNGLPEFSAPVEPGVPLSVPSGTFVRKP